MQLCAVHHFIQRVFPVHVTGFLPFFAVCFFPDAHAETGLHLFHDTVGRAVPGQIEKMIFRRGVARHLAQDDTDDHFPQFVGKIFVFRKLPVGGTGADINVGNILQDIFKIIICHLSLHSLYLCHRHKSGKRLNFLPCCQYLRWRPRKDPPLPSDQRGSFRFHPQAPRALPSDRGFQQAPSPGQPPG